MGRMTGRNPEDESFSRLSEKHLTIIGDSQLLRRITLVIPLETDNAITGIINPIDVVEL